MKTPCFIFPVRRSFAPAPQTRAATARPIRTLAVRQMILAAAIVFACDALHAQSTYSAPGTVSMFAGGAKRGAANGTGSAAQFDHPTGVASDAAGNLYVADTFNHTVRKITSSGVVTTLAGSAGLDGHADGAGGAARFFYPSALAVDSAGNVFVADEKHAIRKISPAGLVTTVAGAGGSSGSADGTGSNARFKNPYGIAVDLSGNVVVADTFNHTIRRISSSGVVTTLAGFAGSVGAADGPGSAARFDYPNGLAVDSGGNIYVADTGNQTIRKITPAGLVSTVAGVADVAGSIDGVGAGARFDNPIGVALDAAGNLYVTDAFNQTVRRITPAGVVTTIAGAAKLSGRVDGVGGAARFFAPHGLAITPAGELFVGDSTNEAIRKVVVPGAAPANDTPTPTGLVSRISNVSVRTTLGANQNLIVGFTMQGSAKPLLLRAVGPGLAAFGVNGTMEDPRCALYLGAAKLEENDNWGGGAPLAAAFANVGGFALSLSSLDAALVRSLAGGHTAQISGPAGGAVLVEVYDAGSGLSSRLTNVSARNHVGSGGDILIAGFTIAGTGPKNVLIRAVGPTLADFGVTGFLADPKLSLYAGAAKMAENDSWALGLAPVIASAGGFALLAGSKDAALIATLPPGGYTVQVSGADGGTGEALIEIYELP